MRIVNARGARGGGSHQFDDDDSPPTPPETCNPNLGQPNPHDYGWALTVNITEPAAITDEDFVDATTEDAWDGALTWTEPNGPNWEPSGDAINQQWAGKKIYTVAVIPTCSVDGFVDMELQIQLWAPEPVHQAMAFDGFKVRGSGIGAKGRYENTLSVGPRVLVIS